MHAFGCNKCSISWFKYPHHAVSSRKMGFHVASTKTTQFHVNDLKMKFWPFTAFRSTLARSISFFKAIQFYENNWFDFLLHERIIVNHWCCVQCMRILWTREIYLIFIELDLTIVMASIISSFQFPLASSFVVQMLHHGFSRFILNKRRKRNETKRNASRERDAITNDVRSVGKGAYASKNRRAWNRNGRVHEMIHSEIRVISSYASEMWRVWMKPKPK